MFELRPIPGREHFGNLAGAMASLCVVDSDESLARKRAEDYLRGIHWQIIRDEDSGMVDKASCSATAEMIRLYESAQRDGIACVVFAGIFGDEALN